MAHEHEHTNPTNGAGYEVEDASVREIVFTGIGLAVGTIIVCFAVAGLLKVLTATGAAERQPITQIPVQQTFPPGPRLQEKPWLEMQELRKKEQEALTTYGWVDKNAGKVRIPIDQAIDIVAQRGLPTRAQGAQTGAGAPKTGVTPANAPPQAGLAPPKGAGAKNANANPK